MSGTPRIKDIDIWKWLKSAKNLFSKYETKIGFLCSDQNIVVKFIFRL